MSKELVVEFEKTELFREFTKYIDVEFSPLGCYNFKADGKTCFYLNGALAMFMELKKVNVWVLTYESNDRNLHGEYFKNVFATKPSLETLELKLKISRYCAIDLVDKGISQLFSGDKWYLREEELK